MSKRFVVATRDTEQPVSFTYPADPISLRIIQDAGGVSVMTADQRAKVKFKTVHVGDDCTDMPEPALSIYIGRGWVIPAPPLVKSEVNG